MRDYQSLITKLRFRSALVRDLSSICFLKSLRTLRLAHGSREKDGGTGKRRERGKRTWELQSGNAPNTPSREPIVFTPSAKCRNPAIRIDSLFLFTSSSITNISSASACSPPFVPSVDTRYVNEIRFRPRAPTSRDYQSDEFRVGSR